MEDTKEKQEKVFETLKSQFNYTNKMQSPRIVKVVVSVGTGSVKDRDKLKLIPDRLSKITGQKSAPRGAKKSIASFKVREGDPVGHMVTLQGPRMYTFLDKLINIAIPRMKDFKGISRDAVDDMGNLTIGIREHTIFPETSDEELKNVFGFAVTVVTSAKTKKEALAFLEAIGIPFKKG